MTTTDESRLIHIVIDQMFEKAEQAILANDIRGCEKYLLQIVPLIERLPLQPAFDDIKIQLKLISALVKEIPDGNH